MSDLGGARAASIHCFFSFAWKKCRWPSTIKNSFFLLAGDGTLGQWDSSGGDGARRRSALSDDGDRATNVLQTENEAGRQPSCWCCRQIFWMKVFLFVCCWIF
jgi:hypothetical protein